MEKLTPKELDVLKLLVKGLSNPEIAKELFVCASTVKVYVKNIFAKLGVKNRVQATAKAIRENLV